MALMNIFNLAGAGMSAQSVRLATTASNLGNAETPAKSADATYKARYPIFSAVQHQADSTLENSEVGVKIDGIYESQAPARKEYQPGHALADEHGFIYLPNVNTMEEMANMISASRSYSMNVQVLNTAKQLMMHTLQMGN